ncbi:acyltransferase, partial [Actinoplanes sp. TFC3]|uniref:acyltransferase family protein n=1 Tax=Actinoplanes sp. TFC3 TaxID=1710355 RepID=UPI003514CA38
RFAVRNRYLDLLRAAAIVRVVVYHLFGWPWLSILLPAMGIMFALAGSLTANSLDKRPARQVVTSRMRRLLPPLWLLGLLAVPVMLATGWASQDDGDHPWSWKLALWILPIGDPPGSQAGIDAWEPLWYIRAYLWFVLLSPLLYLVYKKVGWFAVVAPVALMAVLDKTGFELPFGRADAAMWDFVTYGSCWIAGFAHHDGRLHRLHPRVAWLGAIGLGLVALYWLHGHPGEGGFDLNDVPESQALWSLAFVLVALRWEPDMTWLSYLRPVDRAVTLLNSRAVTIYLWHNIAIAAIWPVLTVLTLDDLGAGMEGPVELGMTVALTGVAVLAFGWVEDLAARRRARLWPASAESAAQARASAQAGTGGHAAEAAALTEPVQADGPEVTLVFRTVEPEVRHPASRRDVSDVTPGQRRSAQENYEEPMVSWFSDGDRR